MLHDSLHKSKSKSPKWILALRYITVAPQTDPIKYGVRRLTYDVIVNITVHCEVKFYPVGLIVKLALTTSCVCIMVLCIRNNKIVYLKNQVHYIVALIAENALKLTYAYLFFKKILYGQKPVQ
jgi:hypothetical protein